MKGTRSALLCLVVALVVGALLAPAASADEYGPKGFPEIGRCVKTAVGQGTYKEGKCQFVAQPENGKYEWIPATQTEKLTFEAGASEVILATLGHPTVNCIGGNLHGEWLSEKHAGVVIELFGCTDQSGHQCTGIGGPNKSEIASGDLIAGLGFIKNVEKTVVVGLDFKPPFSQKALFTYECDEQKGLGEQNAVEGAVIAKIKPLGMSLGLKMILHVRKNGTQDPEQFEGGLKETLLTSYKSGLENLGEGPSTLSIKELSGSKSTKMEIRTKEVPFT